MATWDDRTFLELVHDVLARHVDRVRVLARTDHRETYADLLPAAEVHGDQEPFQGPVEALKHGLPRADQVIVASVDAPGLQDAHVRALLSASRSWPAVALVDGTPLPTLMAAPRDLLATRLEGAATLREVTEDARRVPLAGLALNVNTQEEAPVGPR